MKVGEILALTGATKMTIYRWMERHPNVAVKDENTALGHPFPKPARKDGREVIWDEAAVREWWDANSAFVGRHSEEKASIVMPWSSLRNAMLVQPRSEIDDDTGEARIVEDDMGLVQRYEKQGDQARLWFSNVSDAVLFKLKHY